MTNDPFSQYLLQRVGCINAVSCTKGMKQRVYDALLIHPTLACMNGCRTIDVAKLAFKMNTIRGIQLKRDLFGEVDGFAHPDTSAEVCWQAVFALVFSGLGFHHNYPLGRYRVDFKVDRLNLVLECNGYEHRYYNAKREQEREQFITQNYSLIRFHHKTSVETLFNAILQISPKEIIRLECTAISVTESNLQMYRILDSSSRACHQLNQLLEKSW